MPRSATVDALILRTYDVGEADRFCVVFTREQGRLTARGSGARRPGSRLGPSLLPLSHVSMHLKSSATGWIIAGTAQRTNRGQLPMDAYLRCSEGIELLLRLIQDDEPLPEVFDATLRFVESCVQDPRAPLRYAIELLHLLGFLPETEELTAMVRLSPEETLFIDAAREGREATTEMQLPGVRRVRDLLLREHLSAPLKVPGVAEAMGEARRGHETHVPAAVAQKEKASRIDFPAPPAPPSPAKTH